LQIAPRGWDEFAGRTASSRRPLPQVGANGRPGQGSRRRRGTPTPRGPASRSQLLGHLKPAGELESGPHPTRHRAARAESSRARRPPGRRPLLVRLRRRLLREPPRPRRSWRSPGNGEVRGEMLEIFRSGSRGVTSEVEYVQVQSQYEEARPSSGGGEVHHPAGERAFPSCWAAPGPIPRGKTIDQLTPPIPRSPLGSPGAADILRAEQNLVAPTARSASRRPRTSDHRP